MNLVELVKDFDGKVDMLRSKSASKVNGQSQSQKGQSQQKDNISGNW